MGYLHNNKEIFLDAINLTYDQTGMMVQAIEKDYYVTMILRLLSRKLPFIVFKGGTSLSKCYKVINRFSEDIDLSIVSSITQSQKRYIKQVIMETVAELGLKIENIESIRSRRDYNKYVISYDSIISDNNDFLQSTVLVETSYTAVSFPTVNLPVHSYIGEMMEKEAQDYVNDYLLNTFVMKVQAIERTFVDKIFAVCDYYLQGKITYHSRHLYDIYKLYPLVEKNNKIKDLIREVRSVRFSTGICPSADQGTDVSEILRIIIEKNAYQQDYAIVTTQLLGETVSYDTVIHTLWEIVKSGLFTV